MKKLYRKMSMLSAFDYTMLGCFVFKFQKTATDISA